MERQLQLRHREVVMRRKASPEEESRRNYHNNFGLEKRGKRKFGKSYELDEIIEHRGWGFSLNYKVRFKKSTDPNQVKHLWLPLKKINGCEALNDYRLKAKREKSRRASIKRRERLTERVRMTTPATPAKLMRKFMRLYTAFTGRSNPMIESTSKNESRETSTQTDLTYFIWDTV